jgi:hypothetical protein
MAATVLAGAALSALPITAHAASEPEAVAASEPAPAEPAEVKTTSGTSAEQSASFLHNEGRLLLTGGVSTIEGAGGGGLVPWALIGSYSTRNEIGANAYVTGVDTQDFSLLSYGGAFSFYNRLEVSVARQNFDLRRVGASLGLGNHFIISQTIVGAKARLFGDAVLDQDTWLPQVSVGLQYKHNDDKTVVGGALGLKRDGVDFYAAATKVILSQSVLLNATVRLTKANQYGILGFGGLGGKDQAYKPQAEGSIAYLVTRKLAIGGEYRTKSNRLEGALGGTSFREEGAYDLFAAYTLSRNISVTAAYARLGQIALARQNGAYLSLQVGF